MVINVGDALSAYKKAGNPLDDAASTTPAAAGGESFSDALKGFMGDSINSLREGEKAAVGAVSGKVDMASVVTAIDNAEIVLTEVTAIRDKVISAYQSITSGAI